MHRRVGVHDLHQLSVQLTAGESRARGSKCGGAVFVTGAPVPFPLPVVGGFCILAFGSAEKVPRVWQGAGLEMGLCGNQTCLPGEAALGLLEVPPARDAPSRPPFLPLF